MKRIKQIMNAAFYPFAAVIAFRAYAFDETGKIFALLVVMVLLAAAIEYNLYRRNCQLEVCKGLVLLAHKEIDKLNQKIDDR